MRATLAALKRIAEDASRPDNEGLRDRCEAESLGGLR
jgi:hypothetical protein